MRRLWISVGLLGTLVFVAWSVVASRPTAEAVAATASDADVSVEHRDGVWLFASVTAQARPTSTLLFFPGAGVDPRAYAPLLRAVARAGFPAFLIELPRRGMLGGADDAQVDARVASVLARSPEPVQVALAGHSLGVVVASRFASRAFSQLGALILIGSSHPRDVDLSGLTMPVTKIVGTRDGIATREQVEANAAKLPPSTRWVWIEGGNHSQFGWYGFQPRDWPATIDAATQRRLMINEVLSALREMAAAGRPR